MLLDSYLAEQPSDTPQITFQHCCHFQPPLPITPSQTGGKGAAMFTSLPATLWVLPSIRHPAAEALCQLPGQAEDDGQILLFFLIMDQAYL